MSEKKREKLKEYFETGKKPTEDQFEDLIDSCLNSQDDRIKIEQNGNDGVVTVKIEGKLQLDEGVAINNFVNDLSGEQQNGDNNSIVPTSQAVKSYVQEKISTLESNIAQLEERINAIEKLLEEPDKFIEEDLGDGVKLEMVLIPAGTFLMGSPESEGPYSSERPQHFVSVPAFYMSKFQVTQAQWKAIASLPKINDDLNQDPSYFKGNDRPVETITRFSAVEFCDRLSLKTGRHYRLPSEAEWEYACRAGTLTKYYSGNSEGDLARVAWYQGNSSGQTHSVGDRDPNAFGLYDMHGNVWEFCADHCHDNYKDAPIDGSAWIVGGIGVRVRGGSWNGNFNDCRSACRGRSDEEFNYTGFRIVWQEKMFPGHLNKDV
ncbi:MAG: SUMF1/EgtB/PvdO family nonheme iron enzyme [Prochloraceae cyanobacterium]|nr:SUMF1/EgtB/PvdO family nonheme iron enzyme [Prochloraceae cyanobacterium]